MSTGVRRNQIDVSHDEIEAPFEGDGVEQDENTSDKSIVFLDAASDGNYKKLVEVYSELKHENNKKKMLFYNDGDQNTALHFGAKNGNARICRFIVEEAERLGVAKELVSFENSKGFTPLLEVAIKGYQEEKDLDKAFDMRAPIIEKLLEAGANPNYCKEVTKMTALHWLAYNNDSKAIEVLLNKGADSQALSYDGNMPIDVAGTKPSFDSLRVLLDHYQV